MEEVRTLVSIHVRLVNDVVAENPCIDPHEKDWPPDEWMASGEPVSEHSLPHKPHY